VERRSDVAKAPEAPTRRNEPYTERSGKIQTKMPRERAKRATGASGSFRPQKSIKVGGKTGAVRHSLAAKRLVINIYENSKPPRHLIQIINLRFGGRELKSVLKERS
jgi:hypothetical protein